MNENENMELVEVTEPEVYEEEERSGMPTGLAMLVGGLIALGGAKAFKFAKRKYSEYKAAKNDGASDDGRVIEADFETSGDPE